MIVSIYKSGKLIGSARSVSGNVRKTIQTIVNRTLGKTHKVMALEPISSGTFRTYIGQKITRQHSVAGVYTVCVS